MSPGSSPGPSSVTSSVPSSPTLDYFRINLNNQSDRPSNLFAEEVTVSNPFRVGTGYGSYTVYTCTIKGKEV